MVGKVIPRDIGEQQIVVGKIVSRGIVLRQIDRQTRPRHGSPGVGLDHGVVQRVFDVGCGVDNGRRHDGAFDLRHEVAQITISITIEPLSRVARPPQSSPVGRGGGGQGQLGEVGQCARQTRRRTAHLVQIDRRERVDARTVVRCLVRVQDVPSQGFGVHARVGQNLVENVLIFPSIARFNLFRSNQDVCFAAKLIGHLRHSHKTGVKTEKVQSENGAQRRGDLGHGQ